MSFTDMPILIFGIGALFVGLGLILRRTKTSTLAISSCFELTGYILMGAVTLVGGLATISEFSIALIYFLIFFIFAINFFLQLTSLIRSYRSKGAR